MNKLILKYFSCFIIIASTSISLYSQEWIKTAGNTGDDKVTAATTDIQGNIYVTGFITRPSGNIDYYTVKYSSSGTFRWDRFYDGPGNLEDKAFGITVDRTGTYVYVTGFTTYQGTNTDITTIKYRCSDGAIMNQYTFGDPSNMEDKAYGIAVDRASNVYISGYITRPGIGKDLYIAKYNPNLVFIWHKTFVGNGNGEDRAFGIVTDSLGFNIFVTGSTVDSVNGSDMITINYDSSGTQRWYDIYNGEGSSEDKAFGIAVDRYEGGNIYVTGYSSGLETGADYTTIKYNPLNGDRVWVSKYNGLADSTDKAFGIVVDDAGSCYVTGMSMSLNNQGSDIVTIKYNKEGDTVWTNRFSRTETSKDSASSIVYSKKYKNIFVCGTTIADTLTNNDIVTLKYSNESGEIIQSSRIDMPGHMTDIGVKTVVDTAGNIFVAGYTYSPATNFDYLTMKYYRGQLVIGIEQISSEIPEQYLLYQNYPNPFNPFTKLRFMIAPNRGSGTSDVNISIYDVLGRKAAVLLNEKLHPGTYEIDWNAKDFASGIYFYTLSADGFTDTKKMVLVK